MIPQISPEAWMIMHVLKCVFILNKVEYGKLSDKNG